MEMSFHNPPLDHVKGSCMTANGLACIFPFQHQGKTYDKCVKAGNKSWCATKVHAIERFDWDYCDNVTCSDGGANLNQVLWKSRIDY